VEINVEQLLGTKVRDADGEVIGRIEEIRAERTDDSCYVDSYLVGASAVVERLSAWSLIRPIKKMLRARHVVSVVEVPWQELDLSDPERPVLRVPRSSLHSPR
jgi:sporulation protein YlmC with PRC-barrel domain